LNTEETVEVVQGGKVNIILDATTLTGIMECPRKVDFRHNLHLQPIGGKSNSLETGSIVHKFMEVFYGSLIKGIRRPDAVGLGMTAAELYIRGCIFCTDFKPHNCAECGGSGKVMDGDKCAVCDGTGIIKKPLCGHKADDYPGVKNTPRDSEGFKTGWQWALDTCDQYQRHYINDHWVPLEVEIVKGKILYEDDEIRILWKAKLDWVADTNQGIYPVDHKTMKQRRPTLSLNNQFIGQALLMGTRSVIINKVGFQTTLKPEEKFERSVIPYSAARLIEWQSETLPFYAKQLMMYAEIEHYPPNFSNCDSKYGNCPFKGVCESDPGMRETELKLNFYVGPEWNPTNEDE